MNDYPERRRISAFYAQSVALVEFLTNQRGPAVLTSFVRDGLREGYEPALRKHYGMTFGQPPQAWNQPVLGAPKVAWAMIVDLGGYTAHFAMMGLDLEEIDALVAVHRVDQDERLAILVASRI